MHSIFSRLNSSNIGNNSQVINTNGKATRRGITYTSLSDLKEHHRAKLIAGNNAGQARAQDRSRNVKARRLARIIDLRQQTRSAISTINLDRLYRTNNLLDRKQLSTSLTRNVLVRTHGGNSNSRLNTILTHLLNALTTNDRRNTQARAISQGRVNANGQNQINNATGLVQGVVRLGIGRSLGTRILRYLSSLKALNMVRHRTGLRPNNVTQGLINGLRHALTITIRNSSCTITNVNL